MHARLACGIWKRDFTTGTETHHCEGHELKNAPSTALLQAVHTLLHEPLDKLGVRASCLCSQDGGDQEEEVCY